MAMGKSTRLMKEYRTVAQIPRILFTNWVCAHVCAFHKTGLVLFVNTDCKRTLKRTQNARIRSWSELAAFLLTMLTLVSQRTGLQAGLLQKQKLLALLKAFSQGTRDDQLAFLLLVLRQSQSQRGEWC